MPKVSVCIPVYNVEKYIRRSMESVLSQSLKDIEVLVVNDCTPDASMEIVREYASKDSRIRVIEHEANLGLMMARRTGYKAATGDYITFCDSDDIMPSNAVETLYNLAIESGADIVSGDMEWLYDDGTTKRSFISLPYGSDSESVYRALLSKEYSHTLWSKLFQNSLLQGHEYVTLMHATNGEDGMLFYQVLQHAKKVEHQPKVVYSYYQNNQSSTHVRLKEHALYSIVQANIIRLKTCGRIESLKNATWVCVSQSFNRLLADGYNSDGVFKNILRNEHLEEYVNPLRMIVHYPIKDYIKTMARRIIKPLLIKR